MRCLYILLLLLSTSGFAQWKEFKLTAKGDTLNRVDMQGRKQGPWKHHYDNVRGEPGYEEEGYYENNRREGEWRIFSLMGDLVGIEHYKWGLKDGMCQYFTTMGELRAEQSWKAFNPDKEYDTLTIEDPDKLDTYRKVVVKNEGAAIRHGIWKYYDTQTGSVTHSERYVLGKLEEEAKTAVADPSAKKAVPKPKEVQDFEKKNSGKKKIRYKDGSTGG